jgi:hypothetical protein
MLAATAAMSGVASAQMGIKSLLDADSRMRDLADGLHEVCLPAQRAGMTANEFMRANPDVQRARGRLSNTTKTNMWSVSGAGDVRILEDDAGCTVSMSFWEEDSPKMTPLIRGYLTSQADRYEVIGGDPEASKGGLTVAFCAQNEPGKVDSWLLYEFWGEPQDIPAQRRREQQKFVSVVVPTEPFCPQG